MTDVTTTEQGQEPVELSAADEQMLLELTERARAGELRLTGEGGLLGKLTKMVIEGALEGELDDHLGYGKHDPAGRDSGNSRNGHRPKTVLTGAGPVELTVPRDRDSSFEPRIVAKRQRRLTGVDDMVISLSAKGLTHGEISAHLAEVYGAEVSKQTITVITDRVMEGLAEWQSRPLDPVYAVVFIDAINVKIREGQVANRPVYLALGVTVDGERDVLGLWAGEHGDGEGAKFWLRVLSEIKNRGVRDVCMVVCDGLKGLPDAVSTVWEKTIVQTCIVHLLRNSFKYASKRDWGAIAKDLKPVYTAASEAEALDLFAEFSGKWEKRYPAIIRLWENAWAEFVPFLRFDREIRTVICTTNAIESINARLRRAVNARGHFPTEQAALKCLYLAIMSLDRPGRAASAGPTGGKPPSTPSTSPSTDACPPAGSRTQKISYTFNLTDPFTQPRRRPNRGFGSDAALYGVHVHTEQLLARLMSASGLEVKEITRLRDRGGRWVLAKRQGAADGLGEFHIHAVKTD
jgi:putative transposase